MIGFSCKATGLIWPFEVGAYLLGPEAGELLNTLGLAIKLTLTTGQLKSATAAYLTHGSDLGALL